MWSLKDFRFDEGIAAEEVDLYDDERGELVPLPRSVAIDIAHERGLNLVASWPGESDPTPPCVISKVTLPLRWERVADLEGPGKPDERLWFDAKCGGRDFLYDEAGFTFRGRMSAFCPHKDQSYRVSLSEMGVMSVELHWYVKGFLAGNAPNWPNDDDHDLEGNEADHVAWRSATRRFRSTGLWYGRWGTCHVCGCVLLPDTSNDRCADHTDCGPH